MSVFPPPSILSVKPIIQVHLATQLSIYRQGGTDPPAMWRDVANGSLIASGVLDGVNRTRSAESSCTFM